MDRKQDAAVSILAFRLKLDITNACLNFQFSGFRKVMLFFYILIIVAFVVALVVITVLAPIEDAVESIKKQIMN